MPHEPFSLKINPGVIALGFTEREWKRDFVKRTFDFFIAFIGLLILAPLWLVIAVAIWIESGRPILILQERSGKGGRCFKSIKFRSMVKNANGANTVEDRDVDPRVTRVGRVLRRTALDELPQLLNIFKGDMSFVGPRALYPVIEDAERTRYSRIEDIPGFRLRSVIRPGLTGVAQIYARRDISRRWKFRYDILYIKKQTLWLDIRLILLSVWISIRGKWEARTQKF